MPVKVHEVEKGSEAREHDAAEGGELLGWAGTELWLELGCGDIGDHAAGGCGRSRDESKTEVREHECRSVSSPLLVPKGRGKDGQDEGLEADDANRVVVDDVGEEEERVACAASRRWQETGRLQLVGAFEAGARVFDSLEEGLLQCSLGMESLEIVAPADEVALDVDHGDRFVLGLLAQMLEDQCPIRVFIDLDNVNRHAQLHRQEILGIATEGAVSFGEHDDVVVFDDRSDLLLQRSSLVRGEIVEDRHIFGV
mmetsp:Transcript_24506/g.68294  ORF Transcript_24506/g.68294 Transcript_24506/m.68294 type:complete len:254 (+) Transcript_24506:2425-3186(+)